MSFLLPSILHGDAGKPRRVGFEFEYAGVGLEASARMVMNIFGGREVVENRFVRRVVDARHGSFSILLDATLLKDRGYEKFSSSLGLDLDKLQLREPVEDLLEKVAPSVVPNELVTPPIPLEELDDMESLRARLHEDGALGTGAALRYAFGLHINPEVPGMDVASLRRHLQAFLVLYPRLLERIRVDLSREFTPYIEPFPDDYVTRVLEANYDPEIARFVEDYLEHNPTRNRPLDMLPVLAVLDEARVRRSVREPELVSARPAYHYRLPNCHIDDPDWRIATEWNSWMEVEALAADEDRLRKACADALKERTLEGGLMNKIATLFKDTD